MTTVQASKCPSLFEAGLPMIAYDHLTDRDEAHRVLADARRQAPIAIGPHGPAPVITQRMPKPRLTATVPKAISRITGPTTLQLEFEAGH